MSGDDEHLERQRLAQEQWCNALEYWPPITQILGPGLVERIARNERRTFRPVRVNWGLMPLCELQHHDPGDEDRSEL